jgi:hypothetical protein
MMMVMMLRTSLLSLFPAFFTTLLPILPAILPAHLMLHSTLIPIHLAIELMLLTLIFPTVRVVLRRITTIVAHPVGTGTVFSVLLGSEVVGLLCGMSLGFLSVDVVET